MSAGDYQLGDTVYLPFTTRAFATGVPTVLAGTPVIEIYEDASVTQITTAETLVVSIDSVVGFNMCSVVATSGNGFGTGQSYTAIISAGTVGGVSVVGEVIGHFTVEMSSAAVRLGAPVGASISADIADVPTVAEFNARTIAAASYFDPAADTVANVTLVGTTTTNTDMRGTDSALLAASAPTNFGDLSITLTTGRVDVAAIGGTAQTANDNGADINAILVDTGTDIPARFTGLEGATFDTATDSNEAIRNRGDAAWVTGGGGSNPSVLQNTTIATLASQTSFTLTAGSADNNAYIGMLAIITDSVTTAQKAIGVISAYVGSTRTVTLREDPAIFTMATTDTIDIVAISPDLLNILADTNELQGDWTNAGRLDNILDARMAEASINTTAGAVDNVTLVATTTTNTDMRGTDGVDTTAMRGTDNAALASVATEVRLAELDAANLPATTDSILTDTADIQPNYATSASIAALNDLSAAQILTTQLTESYAADGAAPTLTQALMMIQQMLGDFSITGTTLTMRQIDGATAAATFTLDSATSPTDITRAT